MPSIEAMRALNKKIKYDERVGLSMLPIADGLTLIHKKESVDGTNRNA